MKKNYLFLGIIFLFFSPIFAQQINEGSLESLKHEVSKELERSNYHECITLAMKLIERAEKANNYYYQFHGFNSLGIAYQDIEDTIRARKNFQKALSLAKKTKNDKLLLWSYNNLGTVYSENKDTFNKGIAYYKKVISLLKEKNHKNGLFTPNLNIAWTYLNDEKENLAYPYLATSKKLLKNYPDELGECQLNYLFGRYYAQKKEIDSANSYFEKALNYATQDSLILTSADIYKAYSSMLFKNGYFEKAYINLEKYNQYSSQIFEKDKLKQIEAANARFNVKEYQKNLKNAKEEQSFQSEIIKNSHEKMAILVISSIIMVIILFLLNKSNSARKALIKELKCKNGQLQESKENAERLSSLKTQFFSTVSHELRTPLYGVVGLTSLLLEDKSLYSKHKNDLKSLKFSADYLLALVNDVLQLNKMESNSVELENVSFNLQDLLASITSTFEFTRLQNENKIHLELDDDIPSYLLGDPVRLSQVLMNLVGNASKFTERGNVYVSANLKNKLKEDRYEIYFEIKDDGLGIPDAKQKLIFEEFSQLHPSNYTYQGTGLGLTIVKKMLKLFGSKIHLKSEVNKGSTFGFSIIFEKDTSKENNKRVSKELPSIENLESAKILIVDDNRINQVVTRRILEKKNFSCEVAKNGTQAIEKVQNESFELVLMDLNMPGMNGMEATREIRKFNSKTPIIALTAVEIGEVREAVNNCGMNDIIIKPYDVQHFYQIIYRNLISDKTSENSALN